jgi:hypothetical protein
MSPHRYVWGEQCVTLEFLFNHKIVRVMRQYYDYKDREKKIYIYEDFKFNKRWNTASWKSAMRIWPDQLDEAMALARKNNVMLMGFMK